MIDIRTMTEADIPEVAELEALIFADPWSEKVYRETYAIPEAEYVVAVDRESENGENERIIGASGVRNIVGTGEITNVMITPMYRGRGIAKKMLTDLLERGRRLGVTAFTLEVRTGNISARKLYENLGFVCEGIRPGFYEHPKEDAAIYWLRTEDK